MKILLFSPTYPGISGEGGIGTYTKTLAHALCGLGHEARVLTPGPAGEVEADGPVAVHRGSVAHLPGLDRLAPGAGACLRVGAAVRRLVRAHAIDVVEFPNWEGHGALYAMRRDVPLVVRLHTSSLECLQIDGTPADRRKRWDVYREGWVARWADRLVTHSRAHRLRISEELGLAEGRIDVVPHGIDPRPHFRRPARGEDGLKVVFLGRMERRKGTVDLLQAIPRVLREVPGARFVLIGSDRPHCPGGRTHAEYLREEFPSEVRDRVVLTGRLPDGEVDRHLQEADVFVAPSLYESFGLIFLEAMRWGTPVIGTTSGGIPEVVEHDESGLLVEPSHPAELARAIISLLRNEDLRLRLGEAGRRRVETSFGVEQMARRSAELYSGAIEAKR